MAESAHKKVECKPIVTDEKRSPVYFQLKNEYGMTMQRTITEYEDLYEKIKGFLPHDFDRPPKKKTFFPSPKKLAEDRKFWIQKLINFCVRELRDRKEVQHFLGPLGIVEDEDNVDLGPSERKTIAPNHFEYLKTIGKGSFGRVFMVRYRMDGKIYAMKVLGKARILKRNEAKHVMAERNVLKSNINHPFLVYLHYSFQTKDKLYFVLDFLNGGELFFHLQKDRHFSENRARFYAAEIASALGYLHERQIIYRDLKPENLILDRYGHVVITDFGLCKEGIKLNDLTQTFCGTPEYLAPEIIQKKPYGLTVDWWCLGAVLYEFMFSLPPFYSKDHKEMYEKILYKPLSVPATASATTKQVLNDFLKKDRSERLGAKNDLEEIKEHPFFATIDWEKLLKRELKPPFVPKVKNETDTGYIASEFTDVQPNPASLAPNTMIRGQDTEFIDFTYQPNRLHMDGPTS
ncbi:unnamed protein product [Bursaphelenchus xylophilus]|nr:unnamed protein product [Bursaphelenchus xylophilus]CAG9128306.1 unnamed protein product [Bursaphelenchus xylophilus]